MPTGEYFIHGVARSAAVRMSRMGLFANEDGRHAEAGGESHMNEQPAGENRTHSPVPKDYRRSLEHFGK